MTQSPALADRLRPMAGKLIIWRAEAERIRLIAMEASERRTADPAVLERQVRIGLRHDRRIIPQAGDRSPRSLASG